MQYERGNPNRQAARKRWLEDKIAEDALVIIDGKIETPYDNDDVPVSVLQRWYPTLPLIRKEKEEDGELAE